VGIEYAGTQEFEAGSTVPLGPYLISVAPDVRNNGRYSCGTQTRYGFENYDGGASPFGRVYGYGKGKVSDSASFVEK
jgi:hypothetical protein